MGTSTRVPETVTIAGDELSADDAVTTLRRYGRWNLVKDSFVRFRYADGFTNARAAGAAGMPGVHPVCHRCCRPVERATP